MTSEGDFLQSFLFDRALSDDDLAARLVSEFDRTLGTPQRIQLEAGTVVFTEGQEIDGIFLLLSGEVRLFRVVDDEEIVFHQHTVGPVLGLLAVASGGPAAYTCRAVTDVELAPIHQLDLENALHRNDTLARYLNIVLLRSLTVRQQRAAQQRVEIKMLTAQLATERDELEATLSRLTRAQLRLVESERMATLGELAAGVAHDLNNPVAAIQRAAEFLIEDVTSVLENHPHADQMIDAFGTALTSDPLSTRIERELRRELAEATGDPQLARRMVKVGVTDFETYRRQFGHYSEEEQARRMDEWERFSSIGHSLRSIETASRRITSLVASLRSHARPESELQQGVDLHATIEDSLLLIGHRLGDVVIERNYGSIAPIAAYPGELGQVWTNLLTNALDSMGGVGTLTITTSESDLTTVTIRDTGPGIAPEAVAHVFDMNYTTKQGRVEFGLGLGLTIAAQIVNHHNGQISVTSKPGCTEFVVSLPKDGT